MKIIKYFLLNSNNSINAISLSQNEQFLAFGNSNKEIIVFNYQSLKVYLQTQPVSDNIIRTDTLTSYILDGLDIPKIILRYHEEQVNCLSFSHTYPEILLSGSQDKTIAVWRIQTNPFDSVRLKVIKLQASITDMSLYPDDSLLILSAIDSKVYILHCNFQSLTFDTAHIVTSHDNIVNALTLDPDVLRTGRFASLSDKGRLVITKYSPKDRASETIRDYEELVYANHKCSIQQKKIDWSIDGKWIVSVDHHLIRKQLVLHGRLINTGMFEKDSNVLHGHDSPMLIGKFSHCLYNFKGSDSVFQLLATSDRNGSLFFWRVNEVDFRVLSQIENFSESNVTDIQWTPSGEYVFVVNSTGTVTVIYFDEFEIKVLKERKIGAGTGYAMDAGSKRRINPTMVNEVQHQSSAMNQQQQQYQQQMHMNMNVIPVPVAPTQCLKCQRIAHPPLENKITNVNLSSYFNCHNVTISYINNPHENSSMISLHINSNLLYSNKYHYKMIKLFKANNYFFAYYDTNLTLSISTLLNSSLQSHLYIEEVSILDTYLQYLLILTSQNRLMIIDVFTNTTKVDQVLLINTDVHNVFQTKVSKVDFVDLETIVIQAETVNVYRNCSERLTLLFNSSSHQMALTRNVEECQEMISEGLNKARKMRSVYNDYADAYCGLDADWEKDEREHHRVNGELACYEDKMRDALYFGKKEEVGRIMRKVIEIIQAKRFMFYRRYDLIDGNCWRILGLDDELETIMKEIGWYVNKENDDKLIIEVEDDDQPKDEEKPEEEGNEMLMLPEKDLYSNYDNMINENINNIINSNNDEPME